jgi:glycosyltransferase involved in cell wall biosynthesis
MNPLVSVGMPVFNCEKTLDAAVHSILNQTYSNWELLLIDDGSQDKTLDIACCFQDSRIRVFSDGLNLKLPKRLNQAIGMSQGKYFARMDGDDISYPQRLALQVDYLEKYPEIDLLGSSMVVLNQEGQPQGKLTAKETHAEICDCPWRGFSIAHPTWMGRLDWFRRHPYREDAIRMEDYEFLLRTYPISTFACLSDILLGYRVESLSLPKILNARVNSAIVLGRKAIAERNVSFTYGVLEQFTKAVVETFAITTGLDFKVLHHRLGRPMAAIELMQWKTVWQQSSFRC